METVKDQAPLPSATVLPSDVPPDETATVSLADAVPVKVGVLSDVMLSEFEIPESDDALRSGVDAAATSLIASETSLRDELFAASVATNVNV